MTNAEYMRLLMAEVSDMQERDIPMGCTSCGDYGCSDCDDTLLAPTVGQIQEFASETERSFVDALHFLTATPLSAAARAWLARSPR